jgi:hypothetical protein
MVVAMELGVVVKATAIVALREQDKGALFVLSGPEILVHIHQLA